MAEEVLKPLLKFFQVSLPIYGGQVETDKALIEGNKGCITSLGVMYLPSLSAQFLIMIDELLAHTSVVNWEDDASVKLLIASLISVFDTFGSCFSNLEKTKGMRVGVLDKNLAEHVAQTMYMILKDVRFAEHKSLLASAGSLIYQLTYYDFEAVYDIVSRRLTMLVNSELEELDELTLIRHLCFDKDRLVRLLNDVANNCRFMKKAARYSISMLLSDVIWSWVSDFNEEFSTLLASNTKLTDACDVLYTAFTSEKTPSKYWIVKTRLLLLCPDELLDVHNEKKSDPETLNKRKHIDAIFKGVRGAKPISDIAARCCIDLCIASTYVAKTSPSCLRHMIPKIEIELRSLLFNGGKPFFDMSLIESVSILDSFLLASFRLNHAQVVSDYFKRILLSDEYSAAFRLVVVRTILSIKQQGAILDSSPTIDKIFVLAPYIRRLFNTLTARITSSTHFPSSKTAKTKKELKDKVDFDMEASLLLSLAQLFATEPQFAFQYSDDDLEMSDLASSAFTPEEIKGMRSSTTGGNARAIETKKILTSLSHCLHDERFSNVSNYAAQALFTLHSPENVRSWDPHAPLKTFWEINTGILLAFAVQLIGHNFANLSTHLSWLYQLLKCRVEFLSLSKADVLPELNSELFRQYRAKCEIVLLSTFCSSAVPLISLTAQCMGLLCDEADLLLESAEDVFKSLSFNLAVYRRLSTLNGSTTGLRALMKKVTQILRGLTVQTAGAIGAWEALFNRWLLTLDTYRPYYHHDDSPLGGGPSVPGVLPPTSPHMAPSSLLQSNSSAQSAPNANIVNVGGMGSGLAPMEMPSEWINITGVLCSMGNVNCLQESSDRLRLGSVVPSSYYGSTNPSLRNIERFVSRLLQLLVVDSSPLGSHIRRTVVDSLGKELNPMLYPLLFDQLNANMKGFFSGTAILNTASNTLFVEQAITIARLVLGNESAEFSSNNMDAKGATHNSNSNSNSNSSSGTSSGSNRGNITEHFALIDVEALVINAVEYLRQSTGEDVAKAKIYVAGLVVTVMQRRRFFTFRHESNFRNNLVGKLIEYVSTANSPVDAANATQQWDVDLSCMKAISAVLAGLTLRALDDEETDRVEGKSKLFSKYFTFLMNMTNRSLALPTSSNTTTQPGTSGSNPAHSSMNPSQGSAPPIGFEKQVSLDKADIKLTKLMSRENLFALPPSIPEGVSSDALLKRQTTFDDRSLSPRVDESRAKRLSNNIILDEPRRAPLPNAQLLAKSASINRKKLQAFRNTMRETSCEAMSHLLSANIDVGLGQAIGMGYHQDVGVRLAFTEVLTKVLKQGTEFDSLNENNAQERYHMLMEAVLDPRLVLVETLATACVGDLEKLNSVLVNIFDAHGYLSVFFARVAEWEAKSCTTEQTLFRRNSLATKLANYCCKLFAQSYLRELIQPIIISMMRSCSATSSFSYEVDANRLTPSEGNLEVNQQNLLELAKNILQQIISSESHIPDGLRVLCFSIRRATVKTFPNFGLGAVSGLLFLRFITPSLVSPIATGVYGEDIPPVVARGLLLASKIIQGIANGALFTGVKESFMQFANDFVQKSIPLCQQFLDNISQLHRAVDSSFLGGFERYCVPVEFSAPVPVPKTDAPFPFVVVDKPQSSASLERSEGPLHTAPSPLSSQISTPFRSREASLDISVDRQTQEKTHEKVPSRLAAMAGYLEVSGKKSFDMNDSLSFAVPTEPTAIKQTDFILLHQLLFDNSDKILREFNMRGRKESLGKKVATIDRSRSRKLRKQTPVLEESSTLGSNAHLDVQPLAVDNRHANLLKPGSSTVSLLTTASKYSVGTYRNSTETGSLASDTQNKSVDGSSTEPNPHDGPRMGGGGAAANPTGGSGGANLIIGISGGKPFDFNTLLTHLGEPPRSAFYSDVLAGMHSSGDATPSSKFEEFLRAHQIMNTSVDEIRGKNIFFQSGTSKLKRPVFYFIARRYNVVDIDADQLIFYILLTIKPFLNNPFDVVVDFTMFERENEPPTQLLERFVSVLPPNCYANLGTVYFYNPSSWFRTFSKRVARLVLASKLHKKIRYASLGDMAANINEVALPSSTAKLLEHSAEFHNIVRVSSSSKGALCTVRVGPTALHCISAEKSKIFMNAATLIDVIPLNKFAEIFTSVEEGVLKISLQGGLEMLSFQCGEQFKVLVDAVKGAFGRHLLSEPGSRSGRKVIRPADVPGTLLNMALLNLGSSESSLRLAAYNFLAVLTTTFDFDIGSELLETTGLAIPQNNTNFIIAISQYLARHEPRLTLEFLKECIAGLKCSSLEQKHLCLEYMSPWLPLLHQFSSKNLDTTLDIIRHLIDMTLQEKDLYPSIQAKVWYPIALVDELADFVVYEFLQAAIKAGPVSLTAHILADASVTLASANSRASSKRLIAECSHLLETLARGSSGSSEDLTNSGFSSDQLDSIDRHPKFKDMEVIVTFLLKLSFGNRLDVARNLPDLWFIISMLVGTGTPSLRLALHSITINVTQSLCTALPLDDDALKAIRVRLADMQDSKFRLQFGAKSPPHGEGNQMGGAGTGVGSIQIPGLVHAGGGGGPSDSNFLYEDASGVSLFSLISISETLKYIMSMCSRDEYGWEERWTKLTSNVAFEPASCLRPRAFVVFGVICHHLSGHDMQRVLSTLSVSLLNEFDVLLIESILLSLSRLVQRISSYDAYHAVLFWVAIAVLQIGEKRLFPPALTLIQTCLIEMDTQGVFALQGVADLLLAARDTVPGVGSELESVSNLNFANYFGYSVAGTLLRGFSYSAGIITLSIQVLTTFWLVERVSAGDIAPETMGYLATLLPLAQDVRDPILAKAAMNESSELDAALKRPSTSTMASASDNNDLFSHLFDESAMSTDSDVALFLATICSLFYEDQASLVQFDNKFVFSLLASGLDKFSPHLPPFRDTLLRKIGTIVSHPQDVGLVSNCYKVLRELALIPSSSSSSIRSRNVSLNSSSDVSVNSMRLGLGESSKLAASSHFSNNANTTSPTIAINSGPTAVPTPAAPSTTPKKSSLAMHILGSKHVSLSNASLTPPLPKMAPSRSTSLEQASPNLPPVIPSVLDEIGMGGLTISKLAILPNEFEGRKNRLVKICGLLLDSLVVNDSDPLSSTDEDRNLFRKFSLTSQDLEHTTEV